MFSMLLRMLTFSIVFLENQPVFSKTSEIFSFITYDDALTEGEAGFLEGELVKLKRNPKGDRLLATIDTTVPKANSLKIRKENRWGGHSFSPSRSDAVLAYVDVDFSKAMECPFSSIGCVVDVFSFEGSDVHDFYGVGECLSPFHITLGHELTHFLHFLQDPSEYRRNIGLYSLSCATLYEEAGRTSKLWHREEEFRTVVGQLGVPILDDFSEASLLVAEGRMPRYAYQSGQNFYESPDIIQQIFSNRIAGDILSLVREKPCFSAEEAKVSSLNHKAFLGTVGGGEGVGFT